MYAPGAKVFHNQLPKNMSAFASLKKLTKITWTRFFVLSRHQNAGEFVVKIPTYLLGIIKKMDHLGMPPLQYYFAYAVAIFLVLVFSFSTPYWLWQSSKHYFLERYHDDLQKLANLSGWHKVGGYKRNVGTKNPRAAKRKKTR